MTVITGVHAREILDSRGNPTVEAEVYLSDGAWGRAAVPSGASTGLYEAVELRDGDPTRFDGKGVLTAVANIEEKIAPLVKGCSPFDQKEIDNRLVELDGSSNKSNLGANSILAVSLATARAAASSKGIPLYRHMALNGQFILPVPMFNILNGGSHAHGSTDFQEFMVVPVGAGSFSEALRAGAEIYYALGKGLRERSLSINVGDEGGFAPPGLSNREALELVVSAIERAGYTPGGDCFVALDVAASTFFANGKYSLSGEGVELVAEELVERYVRWVDEYPILSVEDGLAEEDWEGWQTLSQSLAEKVQLVGDDLYVTNAQRITRGVDLEASNAVLIKPNQVGTLTETLEAVAVTRRAGWGTVMSHRSGDTEDTTIADLAIAWDLRQIKAGAPHRSERVAKYNRLLRIEEELGDTASYAGWAAYSHLRR